MSTLTQARSAWLWSDHKLVARLTCRESKRAESGPVRVPLPSYANTNTALCQEYTVGVYRLVYIEGCVVCSCSGQWPLFG